MAAYIFRRILLMIPTLLGIMFVSFVVVQFAPGGPVERVIAQLSGADTGGTSRVSGGGGDFGARGQGQIGASADASGSKYRGDQGLGKAVRLRQARAGAFCADGVELHALRLRQELFPRCQRDAADQGEAAGVDIARPLDDV